jgi:hypothetical protein
MNDLYTLPMTKSYICNMCLNTFTQKHSLTTHLKDRRCKANLVKINDAILQQKIELENLQKLHEEHVQQIDELNELKNKELDTSKLKEKYNQNIHRLREKHHKQIAELTLELECQKQVEQILEPIQTEHEQQLTFDGIFQGRENEIRITSDKMISVFDFIKVAGGQKNPKKTWYDIEKKYKNEVVTFCSHFNFPGQGQKLTPVVNVQGMVKLLFWLPGEMAKQFRSKSAETMIRYLGGDLTLIDEIKMIDQEHRVNPDNIAQVFREEVNNGNCSGSVLFNQDQINTSKRLINYYGDKKDLFYMFTFKYLEEWYAKYGIVGELREFYQRVQEHMAEFEQICFHNIIQCSNIYKVESDFKDTALVQMNKTKIPKKNGGNHIEIIKLSEIVTTEIIKEEMIKVAGDRMLDPPPRYSSIENNVYNTGTLEIEREKTKQKEIEYKCKEKEIESKQLELEMKKLEFEMMKFEYEKSRI